MASQKTPEADQEVPEMANVSGMNTVTQAAQMPEVYNRSKIKRHRLSLCKKAIRKMLRSKLPKEWPLTRDAVKAFKALAVREIDRLADEFVQETVAAGMEAIGIHEARSAVNTRRKRRY